MRDTIMQIQEYNETAAALAVLREKYGTVFDVKTPKGMAAAREARAEVRGYRVALEKLRVEIKAPALERTRLIDAEAKRITASLLEIEEPIDAAIKAEETRKAEERAAKERAEAARVAAIQREINKIRENRIVAANQPSEKIRIIIAEVNKLELVPVHFQEFLPDAIAALDETRVELAQMLTERIAFEEEQARIIAEREELARLRAKDEERKAEQARIEAEAKAKADAEAARIAAAQKELDERQRRIEEEEKRQEREAQSKAEAKAKNGRKKAVLNPLQELEMAVSAGLSISSALKMAYDTGYEDGIKAAQVAS